MRHLQVQNSEEKYIDGASGNTPGNPDLCQKLLGRCTRDGLQTLFLFHHDFEVTRFPPTHLNRVLIPQLFRATLPFRHRKEEG